MKHMLLIYHEEQAWERYTEAERQHIYGEYRQLIQELQCKRRYLAGDQLQPTTTATVVRERDGKQIVTDVPFAETLEQLGGYFLIDARNLDEAITIARRIPSARTGTIEVRPVMEATARTNA